MTDIFDYIMRFVAILFGYCAAVLAAGWFWAAILFRSVGFDALIYDFGMMANLHDASGFMAATGFWSSVFIGGFVLATIAGSASFIPAALVILIAEVRFYRSSLFYCLAGLAIALAGLGTSAFFSSSESTYLEVNMSAAIIGAGIVGGFVYWLIAGRNAGRFLNSAES